MEEITLKFGGTVDAKVKVRQNQGTNLKTTSLGIGELLAYWVTGETLGRCDCSELSVGIALTPPSTLYRGEESTAQGC